MAVFENLQALIDLLDDSPEVAELTLSRPGGEQITIKRPARPASAMPQPQAGGSLLPDEPASSAASLSGQQQPSSLIPSSEEARQTAKASAAPALASDILANRVGIYHSAKPPIESGMEVALGQIIGYIEAIKLMNEVRAASEGTVSELYVKDGMPVEYGQPLFKLTA